MDTVLLCPAVLADASIDAIITPASGQGSAYQTGADSSKGWLNMRWSIFEMGLFWILLVMGTFGIFFAVQVALELGKVFVDWVMRKQ